MMTPELEILFFLIEKRHYEVAREILPIVRRELEGWEEVTVTLPPQDSQGEALATRQE